MRASTFIFAAVLGAAAVMTSQTAFAQSCQDLWVERNSIYKDRGYCFKTSRAISYFGNAGCRYQYEEDIPLSRGARARLAPQKPQERRPGGR